MNKIAIYTAIFGGKDDLKEPHPSAVTDGVDLICFTDDPEIQSDVYQVRQVSPECSDPREAAKRFKILPHLYLPNYEISCWIDGSFIILRPIAEYLQAVLIDHNLAFLRHWDRDCVYMETDESIRAGRLGSEKGPAMQAQIDRYRALGLPEHSGLYAGGALIRRHQQPDCRNFMEAWWQEIKETTIQDQLSLGYLIWKLKPNFKLLERTETFFYMHYFPHCWYDTGDNRYRRTRRISGKVWHHPL